MTLKKNFYYTFNVGLANKYGLEKAVILQHLQFWITKNKANGSHYHEGRTWTYCSAKGFEKIFPFWNKRQIRRLIDQLVEEKVLLKGNFNQNPYDRTLWYAFVREEEFLPELSCTGAPTRPTPSPFRIWASVSIVAECTGITEDILNSDPTENTNI